MTKLSMDEIKAFEKALADQGKVIEAGWYGFRHMTLHPDSPQIQVDEMRAAFFGGAMHLFSTLMSVMDSGADPSDNDMVRMDKIAGELEAFFAEFKLKNFPAEGEA